MQIIMEINNFHILESSDIPFQFILKPSPIINKSFAIEHYVDLYYYAKIVNIAAKGFFSSPGHKKCICPDQQ